MSEVKFYTTKQLMELFRVSRFAIYRANQSGALPIAKKEGTQNLYSEEDVKRFIERTGNERAAIK